MMLVVGFALGVYLLPIITAPTFTRPGDARRRAQKRALYKAEFQA
jgi:hypothetical protein